MASSKKTSKLGLNLWAETDKPERADFVSDNQKLEELVGAHIQASSMHLTTTEKQLVNDANRIFIYSGDGNSTKVYNLPFIPRTVLVFALTKINGVIEDNLQSVFQARIIGVYPTPGITISENKLTMSQQTVSQAQNTGTGYRFRLNEKGCSYCIFATR